MDIVEIARLVNKEACQEAMVGHLRWKVDKMAAEGRRLEKGAKKNAAIMAAIMRMAKEEVCLRGLDQDVSNGRFRLPSCLAICRTLPSLRPLEVGISIILRFCWGCFANSSSRGMYPRSPLIHVCSVFAVEFYLG